MSQRDLFATFSASTHAAATIDHQEEASMPDATVSPSTPAPSPSNDLRFQTAAVRVSFTWMGTRRAVSTEQRQTMADNFEADGDYVSAGKKLINTRHPAYQTCTKLRTRIVTDWRNRSLPFPESGIRLIRQDDVAGFDELMQGYRAELAEAVSKLETHYEEIREEARRRLGALYNPGDYPSSLERLFAVTWEFPSVEPPDYLLTLKPELYEAERARVAAQFDEAVRLAEEAFTEQFAQAITHLCERLGRGDDGNPKVFRDSAVTNLLDFFDRFKSLSVRSNPQLDALVEQARNAVRDVSPANLRRNTHFRETVARDLGAVSATLDSLMVNRPRRNIVRAARPETDQ